MGPNLPERVAWSGRRAGRPIRDGVGSPGPREQLERGRRLQAGSRADRARTLPARAPPDLYRHPDDGARHGHRAGTDLVVRVLRSSADRLVVQAPRRGGAADAPLSRGVSQLSPAGPRTDSIRALTLAGAAPSRLGFPASDATTKTPAWQPSCRSTWPDTRP